MNDSIIVRMERDEDFDAIRSVVKDAFAGADHTDGDEHNLVDRLRQTDDYIRELSLVAESGGNVVGYIMFSRIRIGQDVGIALAPLAVLPAYQRRGIGRALIQSGHRKAKQMGDYCCSVVLGSPEYYSKTGYVAASQFGIMPPFDVPSRFYMVYPMATLLPAGVVNYSRAFGL